MFIMMAGLKENLGTLQTRNTLTKEYILIIIKTSEDKVKERINRTQNLSLKNKKTI